MIQVICSICHTVISNSFYLCSKFHILCHDCCKFKRNHLIKLCSTCDSLLILYIITHENRSNIYEELILNDAYKYGPVVILNNVSITQLQLTDSEELCEISRPSCVRWTHCVNCYKCLSTSRIREHYNHDHRNVFICPLPIKSTISFILNYENLKVSELKGLQMFSSNYQSSEIESEKVFSIMATKVPVMIPTFHDFYYVVLIWLYSQFHSCNVIYTIQAVDVNKKYPTLSFTGQPMDSTFMENLVNGDSTIEEFGQYLVLKKSSFCLNEGCLPEAIINVTIDKI